MKLTKKLIAVFLSVVMAMSCCTVALAKTEEPTPIVIVEGIMIEENFLDYGTENERNTLSAIDIPKVIFEVVKAIVFSSVFHDKQMFVDGFCAAASEALKYFSCDKNGDSVYDIQSPKYPQALSKCDRKPEGTEYEPGLINTAVERYGADYCYFYAYDWRLDPMENAKEINALIETAKKDHNCDKVNFISASMGGVNALAYLYNYGSDSIKNCVFLSSTFCGTYVASDLFSGKIDFNGLAVRNFIGSLIGNVPVVDQLLNIVYNFGVFNLLGGFLNKFVENNKEQIYKDVLRDNFATMPSLWAMVLPEEYEECMNFMFPTEEDKKEYAGLISRADSLQEMLRNKDEMLEDAVENGMQIEIIASYDLALIPAYERATVNGDNTLESELMLGGATVAKYGETLGEDYQAAKPELVSPDNVVDLSTALYPEYTWVIKGAPHVPCRKGSECSNFILDVAESETQPTASNYRDYSQFMRVDSDMNFIAF